MEFKSYEQVEKLAQMVKDEKLCVPKETMVIACSNNSPQGQVQVAAALPTCSKSETEYQANLIEAISSDFKEKHGAALLNWSTDGDAVRRKIFDFLMSHQLKEDSDIYDTMVRLKLVDLEVAEMKKRPTSIANIFLSDFAHFSSVVTSKLATLYSQSKM